MIKLKILIFKFLRLPDEDDTFPLKILMVLKLIQMLGYRRSGLQKMFDTVMRNLTNKSSKEIYCFKCDKYFKWKEIPQPCV